MFSGRLLSCLKKRKISRNGHSLLLVVPLVVIRGRLLSFVVTRCTTRCHSLPLDVPLCLFINDLKELIKDQRNVRYLIQNYYCEKLPFSKLRFSQSKKFVSMAAFGELQLTKISLNFKNQLKNQISGSKTVCGFSIILILKGIMTF